MKPLPLALALLLSPALAAPMPPTRLTPPVRGAIEEARLELNDGIVCGRAHAYRAEGDLGPALEELLSDLERVRATPFLPTPSGVVFVALPLEVALGGAWEGRAFHLVGVAQGERGAVVWAMPCLPPKEMR